MIISGCKQDKQLEYELISKYNYNNKLLDCKYSCGKPILLAAASLVGDRSLPDDTPSYRPPTWLTNVSVNKW